MDSLAERARDAESPLHPPLIALTATLIDRLWSMGSRRRASKL
jgi:hypothetical protein